MGKHNSLARDAAQKKLMLGYRQRIEGLCEVNRLLEAMLYLLLSERGEILIGKKALAEAVGKYGCEVSVQGDAYRVVTARLPEENGECGEEGADADEQI